MKKKVFLLTLLILSGIVIIVRHLPYYQPATKTNEVPVSLQHDDDTLRITYIGDSWAEFHQQHNCHLDTMVSRLTGRPVKVRTAGISGLTSKEIYYSIFQNHNVRDAVINWHPDYCVVNAGVNDSERKMGAGYYKESMRLIVDYMLRSHIVPILLEIPRYNSSRMFRIRGIPSKMLYLTSMLIHLSAMDCIDEYRRTLDELIEKQGWASKIILIRTDSWNPLGYEDERNIYDYLQLHLNEKGYEVLDSCIASYISTQIKNQH